MPHGILQRETLYANMHPSKDESLANEGRYQEAGLGSYCLDAKYRKRPIIDQYLLCICILYQYLSIFILTVLLLYCLPANIARLSVFLFV